MTQPHLKFHNPRTFEDLNKPVPNFRALTLKAGEVPKFFDTVLTRRADEAVDEVGVRQMVRVRLVPILPHNATTSNTPPPMSSRLRRYSFA